MPNKIIFIIQISSITLQSPITADLYASLDINSAQPKSIAIAKQPLYQQSTSNASSLQPKPKKLRHRRIASGSGTTGIYLNHSTNPKSSPVRDRRYQSDPEVSRKVVQLVNSETQTDHTSIMDMSETDNSPSPFVASRELAMCLRDSGRGRSIEDLNIRGLGDSHGDVNRNDNSVTDGNSVVSPNGNQSNSMSRSELTFQDACSGSDDPLDDAMNSNDRQRLRDKTIEEDEDLERLGRRVSAFFTENRHSIRSENGNNGNTDTIKSPSVATDKFGEDEIDMMTVGNRRTSLNSAETTNQTTKQGMRLDVNSTAARRGFISSSGDGREVTVIRCGSNGVQDEVCNDSWTDEEGEDPDKQYLYLRRRR